MITFQKTDDVGYHVSVDGQVVATLAEQIMPVGKNLLFDLVVDSENVVLVRDVEEGTTLYVRL